MLALDVDGAAALGAPALGAAASPAAARAANATGPAQTVAIYGNSRSIALGATLRTSDQARDGLVLSSAARKTIAQAAVCAPASSRAATVVSAAVTSAAATKTGAAPAGGIICTASMP